MSEIVAAKCLKKVRDCCKCEGRKFFNGKTCDNCNGTGFQDGRIPVPAVDRQPKVSTAQWTKAIRSQMTSKKSK